MTFCAVVRGGDRLDGAEGRDTVSYLDSKAGVVVMLGAYIAGGDAQGDILTSIENVRGSGKGDTLVGDGAANRLEGRAGYDYLSGGAGNDTLIGGEDDDVFHFSYGWGRDKVADFGGDDMIYLELGTAFDKFGEVMAVAQIVGDDTRFDFGGGDVLTISNVKPADLSASDFIFMLD